MRIAPATPRFAAVIRIPERTSTAAFLNAHPGSLVFTEPQGMRLGLTGRHRNLLTALHVAIANTSYDILDKLSLLNGFDKNADFHPAADFIADFVPKAIETKLPPRTIWNVNFPSVSAKDVLGVKLTRLGVRMYTDTYEKRVDPRKQVYYWLAGELVEGDESEDSDVTAIRNNFVSVTPVTWDMTQYEVVQTYKDRIETTFHHE